MRHPIMASGLRSAVAAAALMLAGAASAQTGSVVQDGDADMTCSQMADEAAELSAGMGADGPGLLGTVRAVAETGASMLIPGAGLAIAGANALTSSGDARREAETATKRDRWNYLNGLYAGRGCNTAVAEVAAEAQSGETQPGAPVVATPVQVDLAPSLAPSPAPSPSPMSAPTPVPGPRITPASLPH